MPANLEVGTDETIREETGSEVALTPCFLALQGNRLTPGRSQRGLRMLWTACPTWSFASRTWHTCLVGALPAQSEAVAAGASPPKDTAAIPAASKSLIVVFMG